MRRGLQKAGQLGKPNRCFRRQIPQRFGNVAFSDIARTPLGGKQKEAPNPVYLSSLGVHAIPPHAREPPDLIEQFRLALLTRTLASDRRGRT